MRRLLFLWVVVAGCTKADPVPSPAPAPGPAPGVAFAQPPPPAPTPTPPPPQAPLDVTVQLTSVTLADDCGGHPPAGPPVRQKSARAQDSERGDASRSRRRCEQTSMQLAVRASAAATIQIKSVELLDERGTSLGMLTASSPTHWSDSASRYQAWDETLVADTLHKVSYVLAQPNWSTIGNRWNRTYTLKTVVSIGGVDRSATKTVTLRAPTSLPPNVRT